MNIRKQQKLSTKNLSKRLDVTNVRNVTYAAMFTFATVFSDTIAFSTPNWLAADGRQPIKRFNKLGLWEACFHSFRDPHYLFDREFRGCKWIFDEDYAFLVDFLEPGNVSVYLIFNHSKLPLSLSVSKDQLSNRVIEMERERKRETATKVN